MARIWKERDDLPLSKKDRLRSRLQPDLDLGWLYFVEVCGFVFRFRKLEEIQEYIDHYTLKIHPSSRTSDKVPFLDAGRYSIGDHWERQTKFDELPLHLQGEGKRQKVVEALREAQTLFNPKK